MVVGCVALMGAEDCDPDTHKTCGEPDGGTAAVQPADPFEGCEIIQDKQALTNGAGDDEDPRFLRDADGSIVVSWPAFDPEANDASMWFRRSSDGLTWGEPWQNFTPGNDLMSGGFVLDRAGVYHQVGAMDSATEWIPGIWHATSTDLVNWSAAAKLDAGKPYAWGGLLEIDSSGRLWMLHSDRAEGQDLWIMASDDGGQTYGEARRIIDSGPTESDEPFFFKITSDGTMVAVFMRFPAEGGADYLSPVGDSYVTTSADGVEWTEPRLLGGPDPDRRFIDTIPTVLETPNGIYLAWMSDRGADGTTAGGPEVVAQALEGGDIVVLEDAGYSTRAFVLDEQRVIFAFVQRRGGEAGNWEVYYRVYDCS